jgi:hypothetical protein
VGYILLFFVLRAVFHSIISHEKFNKEMIFLCPFAMKKVVLPQEPVAENFQNLTFQIFPSEKWALYKYPN